LPLPVEVCAREIRFRAALRLEARVRAYNLTDSPHFANPNAVLGEWDVQDCNPAISNQPCVSVAGILKQLIVNYSTAFG